MTYPNGEGTRTVALAVTIMSVPASEPIVVCFAGPIVGITTHHHQGRSTGCPGAEKCVPALHRGRTVWKGYAPARAWFAASARWNPVVLEVTECLEESLRGRQLAGEVWMLSRENGKKRSGKVVGAYLERKEDAELLQGFDVRAPLYRLYHTTELEFGVPNPLPPKLVLPAIAAAGPALPQLAAPPEPPRATDEQLERLRRLGSRKSPTATNGNGAR